MAQPFPANRYARCANASGSQWTSGSRVCTSTGKRRFGVVMKTRAADADRFGHEPALSLASADVLDHGVREHDVELTVPERKLARVPLHVADPGVARAEALTVMEPQRGDALRPRVALLEEVQRPAAVSLAEAELVRPDVEHGRLLRGLKLVQEQPELPLARAEGDGIDDPHRA